MKCKRNKWQSESLRNVIVVVDVRYIFAPLHRSTYHKRRYMIERGIPKMLLSSGDEHHKRQLTYRQTLK